MEVLKIIIEKSSDYYDAYAENCEGVYGAGSTAEEAKTDVLKAIELYKETQKQEDLPDILKGEYQIVYRFDVQSMLNYYNKIFTKVALENITGLNQKQLHHYASGLKKPRENTRKKIENALHKLGNELITVEL